MCWVGHFYTTNKSRGVSRTTATSKVELFVIIVNGFQPLNIITKSFTLDAAAVLDPPLEVIQIKYTTSNYFKKFN